MKNLTLTIPRFPNAAHILSQLMQVAQITAASFAILGISFITPPASARQPGTLLQLDDTGTAFEVHISAPEISTIIAEFELDNDQQAILNAMFAGFEPNARRSQTAALKQSLVLRQALHGDSNGTIVFVRQAAKANQAWRIERAEIENRFLTDVQAILTDNQAENWSNYLLHQRRRWTLTERAELAGENVDLIALAAPTLQLTPVAAQDTPILKQYARELDALLQARNLNLNQIEDRTAQRARPPAGEITNLLRNALRNRLAIVDLNQKYLEDLAQSLDSTSADNLRLSFERASFPSIHAKNEADRYFKLVRNLDDLTPSQAQSLDEIELQHNAQLAPLNRSLVSLLFKLQRLQPHPGSPNRSTQGANSTPLINDIQTRIEDLTEEKSALLTRTINRIFALLTPEQQERLPKPTVNLDDTAELTALINEAIDFAATNLELPAGMDRQEFVAAIRQALQGISLQGLAISGPTTNRNGQANGPIAVTGAGGPDDITITVPIEAQESDNHEQDEDDGG